MLSTVASSFLPANASERSSASWPLSTRGMSSSLTSAITTSGVGRPTQNSTEPGSAISPTSASWRSTTPSPGAVSA